MKGTPPWGMRLHVPIVVIVMILGATVLWAEGGAPSTADSESFAQEVRATERAFSATMAARDRDAFATFIAADAIFLNGGEILRGREEIVAGWGRYFRGEDAPFSWEPDRVEVLESGELALSTGPVTDPQGMQIGTFTSIWRRQHDGEWKIVFDRGCPICGES